MLIYVAGPYSAANDFDRSANVSHAMAAGKALMDKGHWPFVPHLNHYFDIWHELQYGHRLGSETYMQWDLAILHRCEALLFLASSPGADRELALARELRLPVFMGIEEVPPA